jgi:WD40 repeat protein
MSDYRASPGASPGSTTFYALLFPISLLFPALVILGGFIVLIQGVLRLSIQPGEFWGWMGIAIGCFWGGLSAIRGTMKSFRQVEGAPDLVLNGLVRHCHRYYPVYSEAEIHSALQEPHWTWLDRLQLPVGVLGFVGLGGMGFLFAVAGAFGPEVLGPAWPLLIILFMVSWIALLKNLPASFRTARYLPARLLVRRSESQEKEAGRPESMDGARPTPPGLGPKLRVIGIGCAVSSVLMLLGVWQLGNTPIPEFAGASWAGLIIGLPAILAAWPSMLMNSNPTGQWANARARMRRMLTKIRGTEETVQISEWRWRGWETVMEDPQWNWFDTLTAGWLAMGILGMIVSYVFIRSGIVIVPSFIKSGVLSLVTTFVIQGLLFFYARFAIRSPEVGSRHALKGRSTGLLAVVCLVGVFTFSIAYPKLPTVRLLREFHDTRSPCLDLAISPDGQFALTGHEDGGVLLWDLDTGALVRRFAVSHKHGAFRVAFSPDGKVALSCGWDGLYLWDLQTGQETRRLVDAQALYPMPNGEHMLTSCRRACGDGEQTVLELRRFATGDLIRQFELGSPGSKYGAARVSADARQLVAAYQMEDEVGVRLLDVGTGEERHCWKLGISVKEVAFVHEGQVAVAVDYGGNIHFWDTKDGRRIRLVHGPGPWLDRAVSGWYGFGTAVFAQSRRLATVASVRDLRLHDLERGSLVYTGDIPHEKVRYMAGSSDGHRLLTCDWKGNLLLWELPNAD